MADDLYVELDTRPDRGDGPKRKYYFRCRCDICVEDERGFTLQLYQRIWRGVTTTDKLTWEPQSYRSTGGEKDTRGHLRKSLDRYHQNRLKPVQKNAEGQMNDATKQALKALKDRILVCWNDQSGTDTWWRNAYSSRIQTAAGIETDHDGDDRDGDDHDTWSAGSLNRPHTKTMIKLIQLICPDHHMCSDQNQWLQVPAPPLSSTASTSRSIRLAEGLLTPVRSAFLLPLFTICIALRYVTSTDSRSPGTDQVRTK